MERLPEDPPEEIFTPRIEPGMSNQIVLVKPFGRSFPEPAMVDVMPQQDATVAYKIDRTQATINLDHHAPGWGSVFFGIRLRRANEGHFEEPDPADEECRVAIKRLSKAVVDAYLALGGEENPYKEVHRMQNLGDDQHVLGCLDVLEDNTSKDAGFLYIISKKCTPLVSMRHRPEHEWDLDENSYRPIFQRMINRYVENVFFSGCLCMYIHAHVLNRCFSPLSLAYLHEHNICHADIKPANFMVIRHPGYVLLNDLAMSFQMPEGGLVNRRPRGPFGTYAYMPWEVYQNAGPFDAEGRDLWACLVTLFNLITGLPVYQLPVVEDILFRYKIMAQALGVAPDNPRAMEVLQEHPRLQNIRLVLVGLSPQLRELFENVFHFDYSRRWTIDDVRNCAWFRGPPYPP